MNYIVDLQFATNTATTTVLENAEYFMFPQYIIVFLMVVFVILFIFNFKSPWRP